MTDAVPAPAGRPGGGDDLVAALRSVVEAGPGRPAVRDAAGEWRFGDLWERAGRVAGGLLDRLAVRPGARVGILGENSAEYLAAYFGILRAGCVAVPLNQLLRPEEHTAQLELVGARDCLVGRDFLDERLGGSIRTVPITDVVAGPEPSSLPPVGPADDATILLTSGTTGRPKGAVQTHATMRTAVAEMHAALPFARDDVMLAFLPFFASIPEQILPSLLAGACVEVLPRFDLDRIADACDRATAFDAVPTLMARLIDGVPAARLSRLRWLMFASEPMPPALLARWWEELPTVATYQFYGMTEMLTITAAGPELMREAPTSVGRPFPRSQVAVIGPDGAPAATGDAGEVVCASPARMRTYLPDGIDPATWRLADGSMRTGDLGRLDEAGRLHLTGRIKDIIISGGMNIAPSEIEAVAAEHPGVATSVVVGVPDARWGETPILVVVAKAGQRLDPQELLRFCRGRVASYKRPRGVAIVESLPATGIGKSSKAAIREHLLGGGVEVFRDA
ncbi:MAG TPA: AMP-binding protein [Candidatus Limnocylindrales bacterium]|nr:AMP-binding protein [Candidatus Limnocylindrales bacterium]